MNNSIKPVFLSFTGKRNAVGVDFNWESVLKNRFLFIRDCKCYFYDEAGDKFYWYFGATMTQRAWGGRLNPIFEQPYTGLQLELIVNDEYILQMSDALYGYPIDYIFKLNYKLRSKILKEPSVNYNLAMDDAQATGLGINDINMKLILSGYTFTDEKQQFTFDK